MVHLNSPFSTITEVSVPLKHQVLSCQYLNQTLSKEINLKLLSDENNTSKCKQVNGLVFGQHLIPNK